MRKLALMLFFLVPVFGACDGRDATAPEAEPLEAETNELASAHGSQGPMVNHQLAALRQATVAYHDTAAARAAGYHMEPECVSAASEGAPAHLGAMGYHFVNPSLVDGTFEPLKPEVLVYEPREDGGLYLAAVEYLYVGEEAPSFADEVQFHEFPLPFADFALHAWVWVGNPSGTFADFNPNVSCPTD